MAVSEPLSHKVVPSGSLISKTKFMAVSMLLDHLGEAAASKAVEHAVAGLVRTGRIESLQAGRYGTDELGKMVEAELIAKAGKSAVR